APHDGGATEATDGGEPHDAGAPPPPAAEIDAGVAPPAVGAVELPGGQTPTGMEGPTAIPDPDGGVPPTELAGGACATFYFRVRASTEALVGNIKFVVVATAKDANDGAKGAVNAGPTDKTIDIRGSALITLSETRSDKTTVSLGQQGVTVTLKLDNARGVDDA